MEHFLSGEPIVREGADIAAVGVEGTGRGAQTSEAGRFAISLPVGTYTLLVRSMGHAPTRLPAVAVNAGRTTTVAIKLVGKPILMPVVTVHSSLRTTVRVITETRQVVDRDLGDVGRDVELDARGELDVPFARGVDRGRKKRREAPRNEPGGRGAPHLEELVEERLQPSHLGFDPLERRGGCRRACGVSTVLESVAERAARRRDAEEGITRLVRHAREPGRLGGGGSGGSVVVQGAIRGPRRAGTRGHFAPKGRPYRTPSS